MTRKLFLTFAMVGVVCAGKAQTNIPGTLPGSQPGTLPTTQDSVKAAVKLLFTSMNNSDSAQLVTAFDKSAVLQTIYVDSQGVTRAHGYPVTEFAAAISKIPKGSADEQVTFETIKIDGPLASVWAPYHFYYNGTLLHCGVDVFQLIRTGGMWKILYIVDTRRKGCE